jgi:predicted enzyme related to lactoylglutathione lyase
MSTTQVRSETTSEISRGRMVDMKLEVVVIPVSDVDRAKAFYSLLGWRLDADFAAGISNRQGCCTSSQNSGGSAQGLYLIVSDIGAAHAELLARGVEVSEIFHDADGVHAGPDEPYLFGRDPHPPMTPRTPQLLT